MKRLFLILAFLFTYPSLGLAAITFANLGVSTAGVAANPDIEDPSDTNIYANTSWTPPTEGLIIVGVVNRAVTDAQSTTPSISGNNLTWTQIATVTYGTGPARLTIFGANASGSATGVTTVSFSVNQRRAHAHFFHATGVDLSGGVAAAFIQTPTNTGTGTEASVNLSAAGHANNRPISFSGTGSAAVTTARANWDKVDELDLDTPTLSQWRTDAFETTASTGYAASEGWAIIAAEIKAAITTRRRTAPRVLP